MDNAVESSRNAAAQSETPSHFSKTPPFFEKFRRRSPRLSPSFVTVVAVVRHSGRRRSPRWSPIVAVVLQHRRTNFCRCPPVRNELCSALRSKPPPAKPPPAKPPTTNEDGVCKVVLNRKKKPIIAADSFCRCSVHIYSILPLLNI